MLAPHHARTALTAVTLSIAMMACAPGSSGIPAPQSLEAGRSAEERVAISRVHAERIREVTIALTAERMEGRDTGSPGGANAARYLATEMERAGLRAPDGRTSLLQPYAVIRTRMNAGTTVLRTGSTVLRFATDFIGADDALLGAADVSGPIIFVGYGVRDSLSDHDDLAGADVRGKIVVLLAGRPSSEAATPGWVRAVGSPAVVRSILRGGAIAILLVDQWQRPFEIMARGSGDASLALAAPSVAPRAPVLIASVAAAERLFASTGTTFAIASAEAARGLHVSRLLASSASIVVRHAVDTLTAYNVVGVLPGTSSSASEAVLFMAHFDALGRDEQGLVRSGAADNALGTGMLLAVADALARGSRPRRSVIFLATSGEERGMLGATHWADHPARPLDSIVAAINFDGIGTEVYGPVRRVVGYGADLSSLGATLAGAEDALGMRAEADPFAAQRPFLRSDHIVLARRGIPSLMLLGLPADSVAISVRRAAAWIGSAYHQPGDTVRTDWDWRGPRDVAALAMLTGLRAANAARGAEWRTGAQYQRPAAGSRD